MRAMALLALLALLVLPLPCFAQMYKCVDERGVTSYSDKPRPGCKGAEVDIKPSPRIGTAAPAPSRDLRQDEADFQRRRIQREREEEKAATSRAALERRCASLHIELQRLAGAGRLYTVNAKGEKKEVDEAARQARVSALKAEIERQCR